MGRTPQLVLSAEQVLTAVSRSSGCSEDYVCRAGRRSRKLGPEAALLIRRTRRDSWTDEGTDHSGLAGQLHPAAARKLSTGDSNALRSDEDRSSNHVPV